MRDFSGLRVFFAWKRPQVCSGKIPFPGVADLRRAAGRQAGEPGQIPIRDRIEWARLQGKEDSAVIVGVNELLNLLSAKPGRFVWTSLRMSFP